VNQRDAVILAKQLFPQYRENRADLDTVDSWYRGQNERPTMPRQSTKEYQQLQERSYTPWLGLVVTSVAQTLYVEGYRRAREVDDAAAWGFWQANGLDGRQMAVHRGALAHGQAFVTVLPGDRGPAMRGVSARKMHAVYADPAEDEYPMYALRVDPNGGANKWMLRLYDEKQVYYLSADSEATKIEFLESREHGIGVCPVVRFTNQLDLDGRATGEIAPFVPLAARIDQDTFDRLVVQRFGAWVIKYVAGMATPETDEEKRAAQIALKVSDFLMAEDPDTKFGSLPATPLDGYIKSRDADIRDLAAVTQTPPHHLLGQMANLSAEALAAAESSLIRKVEERKHSFGESWEQALRLAASVADVEGSDDFEAQVRWRDMESRSLSQVADALGKLSQQLGVPVEMLWEKIPGWTDQDVLRAKTLAAEGDALASLNGILEQQAAEPELP
jgi:hypothetical protein